jgi:hypothetical protein
MKSCKFNRHQTTHKIAPQMLYFMGSIIIQPMELGPTDDNYFICCRMTSLTRGQSERARRGRRRRRKEEQEQRRRQGGAAVEDIKEFFCCDVDVG